MKAEAVSPIASTPANPNSNHRSGPVPAVPPAPACTARGTAMEAVPAAADVEVTGTVLLNTRWPQWAASQVRVRWRCRCCRGVPSALSLMASPVRDGIEIPPPGPSTRIDLGAHREPMFSDAPGQVRHTWRREPWACLGRDHSCIRGDLGFDRFAAARPQMDAQAQENAHGE
jgi:hypothetical protein